MLGKNESDVFKLSTYKIGHQSLQFVCYVFSFFSPTRGKDFELIDCTYLSLPHRRTRNHTNRNWI